MARKAKGLVRPHTNKIISLYRLFDTLIISVTLWAVLSYNYLEWNTVQTTWLLLTIIFYQFFAELTDIYSLRRDVGLVQEIWGLVTAWSLVVIALSLINNFYPLILDDYKETFWYWLSAVPIELFSWHIIVRATVEHLRASGKNTRQVALVGMTKIAKEVETILNNEPGLGMRVSGYYDSRRPKSDQDPDRIPLSDVNYCGDYAQLYKDANEDKIDIVYITLPMKAEHRIKEVLDMLSDTTLTVYFVPDLFLFDLLRAQWRSLQGIPVISIYDTPFYGIDGMLKRIFDIVVSLLILTLILVPMLLIALLIKLDSRGPVIFKQRRYGFNGEKIVVWKFRSMKVCQDGENVPQAQRNDSRVTRLGHFLRKTSLDELPQFINVLQGRMSIVGPRPHAITHNEFYRKQIKGYMLRHKVKPGITGWAQINGYRGETETLDKMEGRIKLDLEYIRNWSILLDIKIILLTAIKEFVVSKAY
ncbi:undecaprenyl-phosphate glucose phosphotransferase [Methylocucumis oryzae]|uniref:Capsule biosynthesis protein CapH n=1 Tax=Methylocucumis oryzae TaxID=1632867 RepID=A0A0F3IJU5_9GAMM|nr:undecaprenyl-phosphate glucose phosphotransferase [Methylocucumis oryzae]KJV05824.1 capsule biosynthesis protein CapH [Methylocucumis oryzae]